MPLLPRVDFAEALFSIVSSPSDVRPANRPARPQTTANGTLMRVELDERWLAARRHITSRSGTRFKFRARPPTAWDASNSPGWL